MKTLIYVLCLLVGLSLPPMAAAREREHHPEIHEAIAALEKAKRHMEHADHDFRGHRREALEACNRAIHQLRLALESDRR
jgi:transcription elongation GreA/GreB family factor